MASTVPLRAQAASLRRDFPGWHFIISSAGRIWAQRRQADFAAWAAEPGNQVRPYERSVGVSAMKIDCKIKLANEAGWVGIVVDLALHAASDEDRTFVVEVLRLLTAWTGPVQPPADPVVVDKRPAREMPEVLRGVTRSAS